MHRPCQSQTKRHVAQVQRTRSCNESSVKGTFALFKEGTLLETHLERYETDTPGEFAWWPRCLRTPPVARKSVGGDWQWRLQTLLAPTFPHPDTMRKMLETHHNSVVPICCLLTSKRYVAPKRGCQCPGSQRKFSLRFTVNAHELV